MCPNNLESAELSRKSISYSLRSKISALTSVNQSDSYVSGFIFVDESILLKVSSMK